RALRDPSLRATRGCRGHGAVPVFGRRELDHRPDLPGQRRLQSGAVSHESLSYLGEYHRHWRPLLASTLGHGAGLGVMAYIFSTFAPHLLQAFGWTKDQFALV